MIFDLMDWFDGIYISSDRLIQRERIWLILFCLSDLFNSIWSIDSIWFDLIDWLIQWESIYNYLIYSTGKSSLFSPIVGSGNPQSAEQIRQQMSALGVDVSGAIQVRPHSLVAVHHTKNQLVPFRVLELCNYRLGSLTYKQDRSLACQLMPIWIWTRFYSTRRRF